MNKSQKGTRILVSFLAGITMIVGLGVHPGCDFAGDEAKGGGRKCKKRSDCRSCEVCGHSTCCKYLVCIPCSQVGQTCVKGECYPFASNP